MGIKALFQLLALAFVLSPVNIQPERDGRTFGKPNSPEKKKSFHLFDEASPIETTLVFDLSSYFRKKPKGGYIKARITFNAGQKDSVSRNIKLTTRGIFRERYCYYSPIELNFKNVDFGYSDLDRISKIKLVPPCRAGKENEGYLLREYLIYKMFNILTDTSFRVRLLNLTCIDSENKRKTYNQYAFLIEPVEMLAKRTNSLVIKSKNLNQRNIVPRVMDRLAIFNYMIGNYDWSVPGQHNVKILKPNIIDSLQYGIAIPYDFDWTGVVDAVYAVPAEIVGVETVRERLFLGMCRSRSVYARELQEFVLRKNDFYRVINEFEYLNTRDKKDIIHYLDGFFDNMTGKDNVLDILLNSCKKM